MDVHWNMRQSGGHAVDLPIRPVTLRPCLSTGLPFLLFELFLSTSFIGPHRAVETAATKFAKSAFADWNASMQTGFFATFCYDFRPAAELSDKKAPWRRTAKGFEKCL